MSKQTDAIAEGKLTYSSGKPCRAGHNVDRYVSNGMCVECVRLNTEARRDAAKNARAKRNMAMVANLRERNVMVAEGNLDMLEQFVDILQYSNPTDVNQLRGIIAAKYQTCPVPRALKRADLLMFMDYHADGTVRNVNKLNISHSNDFDGIMHIHHNGHWYMATECMEVLRNQRINATPKKLY